MTGACIRATSSRLNYGAILFNESGHVEEASNVLPQKSEAAMHFRIVLAYVRAWPHKDAHKSSQKLAGELLDISHKSLRIIDDNYPAARRKGEEMAAEHFRALEKSELWTGFGCDPLALYFRGYALHLKVLRASSQGDSALAAYLAAELLECGFTTDVRKLQSGERLSPPMTAEQAESTKRKSRRLLKLAAAKGEPNANLILGMALQQDAAGTVAMARACGYEQDYTKAAECFRSADACDIKEGTHNLGRMYQHNRVPGVDDDDSQGRAIELFETASAQGNHYSTVNLAGIVAQLGERARCAELLRKAIQDGFTDAEDAAKTVKQYLGLDIWDPCYGGRPHQGQPLGGGGGGGGDGGGGGGDGESGGSRGGGAKKKGKGKGKKGNKK